MLEKDTSYTLPTNEKSQVWSKRYKTTNNIQAIYRSDLTRNKNLQYYDSSDLHSWQHS